jgi:small subunit ribosomal protein S6
MHGPPPLVGIGEGLRLVHAGLGRLELVSVVNDRPGLVQPGAQLLGARVWRGLRLHPPGGPTVEDPPDRGEPDRKAPSQERQPAVHQADATLGAASCLALRRVPKRRAAARPLRPKEGGFGTVTPYEILLMLDPELPEERQSEIVQRTRELVERGGGTVDSHDVWGRRKLSYEIDHKTDGTYHLLTFSAETETLEEISRILKITDGVMRHLAVRRSERRPGGTVAASAPARQDGAQTEIVVQEEE